MASPMVTSVVGSSFSASSTEKSFLVDVISRAAGFAGNAIVNLSSMEVKTPNAFVAAYSPPRAQFFSQRKLKVQFGLQREA
jgi:hypothetical protein